MIFALWAHKRFDFGDVATHCGAVRHAASGEHGARSAERQRRFSQSPFTRQMLRKCTAQRCFCVRRRVVRQPFTQMLLDGFRRSASGVQRLRQAEMPGSIRRFQFQRSTCGAFCGADLSLFE